MNKLFINIIFINIIIMNKFKKAHSFDKRKDESARIIEKYVDRVPLIVIKDTKSDLPEMDKSKFLAPHDLTLGQFMYVIRKRIKIDACIAMFLFANDNVLVNTSESIIQVYEKYKDEDGFLYLTYCSENVFG
jgi:GABA(A) receptor-associated protein